MNAANFNLAVLQVIAAAFAAGTFIGFAFRSRQIAKSKRRILELETEMVENHAEILKLHKLQSDRSGNTGTPVINLKITESLPESLKLQAKA